MLRKLYNNVYISVCLCKVVTSELVRLVDHQLVIDHIISVRINAAGNAVASVGLSIHPFVSSVSSELTDHCP